MTLQEKIDHSVALIRKAEKLALVMQPDKGFHVGFSGGKDSQAVLELVKMAGVKYRAVYNVTTNDPADNVRFIKRYYPDVEFSIPDKSYFQLIEEKGVPTIMRRWCCALYKETAGLGCVVLTGVRKDESRKRATYEEISRWSRMKDKRGSVDIEKMEANKFQCVNGKDKFLIYPILEWSEKDVWEFIKQRDLPINPCYKLQGRVGCVFCPFSKGRDVRTYCNTHPRLRQALIHAIERYMKRNEGEQKKLSAEEYFDCWLKKTTQTKYIAQKSQLKIDLKYPTRQDDDGKKGS